MKISKAKLRQIIKEEIARSFDDSRRVKSLKNLTAWGAAFGNALKRSLSEGSLSQEVFNDLFQKRWDLLSGPRAYDRMLDLIKDVSENFDFAILKVDTEEWMEPTFWG